MINGEPLSNTTQNTSHETQLDLPDNSELHETIPDDDLCLQYVLARIPPPIKELHWAIDPTRMNPDDFIRENIAKEYYGYDLQPFVSSTAYNESNIIAFQAGGYFVHVGIPIKNSGLGNELKITNRLGTRIFTAKISDITTYYKKLYPDREVTAFVLSKKS